MKNTKFLIGANLHDLYYAYVHEGDTQVCTGTIYSDPKIIFSFKIQGDKIAEKAPSNLMDELVKEILATINLNEI